MSHVETQNKKSVACLSKINGLVPRAGFELSTHGDVTHQTPFFIFWGLQLMALLHRRTCLECGVHLKTHGAKRCRSCQMRLSQKKSPRNKRSQLKNEHHYKKR